MSHCFNRQAGAVSYIYEISGRRTAAHKWPHHNLVVQPLHEQSQLTSYGDLEQQLSTLGRFLSGS